MVKHGFYADVVDLGRYGLARIRILAPFLPLSSHDVLFDVSY